MAPIVVDIAVDRGLSLEVAAGVLAVQHGIGVFARGAVPVIAERWGCRSVWIAGMSLQAFPLLIILFAHDAWAFYVFAILFGVGQSCEVPPFLSPIASTMATCLRAASLGGRHRQWPRHGNGTGIRWNPVGHSKHLCGSFDHVPRV